jgi:hypothetical protein
LFLIRSAAPISLTAKTYDRIGDLALGLIWSLPVHYQGTESRN